ncbi:DUF4234 domain-containing protein [Candidatus Saccharibacteria bacterium]|nr:DUF4234 domain-containing protein [Candidatus Saccharibacteria bacterium]
MKRRSLLAIFLLNIVTLGLYQIYWYFITKTEMNTLNAKALKVPFFLWFFIPIIDIWWFWRFAKAIEATTKGAIGRWAAFLAPVIIWVVVGIFFGFTRSIFISPHSLVDSSLWISLAITNVLILLPIFYYQSNLNKVAR